MSISQKIISGLSDKWLIEKAKKGDKVAYGKLYMKYLDQIYRYIYFRVNNNRFESEDLTEIVFLKAWDNIRRGNFRNENFRAWIFRIARNIVIDNYRKNTPYVPVNQDFPASVDLLDDFIKDSKKQEIASALNSLPGEQKEVVSLKFISGLKNEDIAGILNKTKQAVRALQYRALKNLRKQLDL